MQSSGESEVSGENKSATKLTLTFWQSFLLTLAGAVGLISLVTDAPQWLSVTGFILVIILLVWILVSQRRNRKK